MAENKILVIRGGAIGDFILTLPVLGALRRQFPETRLEVLGYPHIAQLAVAGGLADAVHAIEARGLAGFFARDGELAAELQSYFAAFAIIISYLYDPDGVFEANVKRCSRAQFIAGPHRPDDTTGVHATEVLLKPLERLAIFDADPVPRLRLNIPSITDQSRPCLAAHPGSGSERKNWPESIWTELLDNVIAEGESNLLLIGGEADAARIERLSARLPPARAKVAFNRPLPELAASMSVCDAFVGHDSGISHLAAALGLPSVLLWGETAEAVWRPRGEHCVVVRMPAGLPALIADRD